MHTDELDEQDLFTLTLKPVPENAALMKKLRALTKESHNRKFYNERTESFHFKATQRSKYPGKLVSFGTLPVLNDIVLPDGEYWQVHFQFFLTLNGDLMIEDLTSGHHVTMEYKEGNKRCPKYSLQGDPRRRVIPRGLSGEIKICIGGGVDFHFKWELPNEKYNDVRLWGDRLSKLACQRHEAACKMGDHGRGRGLTRPSAPNLPDTAYEKKTRYTPEPAPQDDRCRPLRKFHRYDEMEASKFRGVRTHKVKNQVVSHPFEYEAVVYEAVDLATGDIFALKERVVTQEMREDKKEHWKANLKAEVEKLLALEHRYILKLIHHQGWSEGLNVQLAFEETSSSVFALCHKYDYLELPMPSRAWVSRFSDQMLQAIEFLHGQNFVHGDIKPQAILIVEEQGKRHFRLNVQSALKRQDIRARPLDQSPYLAPEVTKQDPTDQPGDMYAFGITLLEVAGYFCPQEREEDAREWAKKLRANGVKQLASYTDEPNATKADVVYSRVSDLCDYRLIEPSIAQFLPEILQPDPKKRYTAERALHEFLKYDRHSPRDGSASRDGRSSSRHSEARHPTADGRGRGHPPSSTGRSRTHRDGSKASTHRFKRDPPHDSRR